MEGLITVMYKFFKYLSLGSLIMSDKIGWSLRSKTRVKITVTILHKRKLTVEKGKPRD